MTRSATPCSASPPVPSTSPWWSVRTNSARRASKDMLWEWEAMARDMAWDYPLGLVAPAGFALHVARYLHESPATREHMAMVAVKNHLHGVNNPKARLRFEITIEEALAAPTVVTPFRPTIARRRATARQRLCWPPKTSWSATPIARSGSAASASAWIPSCTSTSVT